MIYELQPHNGRKSFYGKAKVIKEENKAKLISYDTIVAEYDMKTDEVKIFGYYSVTTATHINAFLTALEKPTMTKKQILAVI